jgi:hypothetical protein
MVSAVGSAHGANAQCPSRAPSGGSSVQALEGRIRQAQIQLNDWTTCVSANTPKGQAAIQKLSGEISAAKEQIARTLQAQSATPPTPVPDTESVKAARSLTGSAASRPGAVDVWA